jgi:hypothetical protein
MSELRRLPNIVVCLLAVLCAAAPHRYRRPTRPRGGAAATTGTRTRIGHMMPPTSNKLLLTMSKRKITPG